MSYFLALLGLLPGLPAPTTTGDEPMVPPNPPLRAFGNPPASLLN